MSTQKLQQAHDNFVKGGVATFVPAVKTLLASVQEHITDDATSTASDANAQKITYLEAQVVELTKQVAELKKQSSTQEPVAVVAPQPVAEHIEVEAK